MPQLTAIVSGGSSGIGRECARLLLERGYHVAILDLREEEIQRAHPGAGERMLAVAVDLGDTIATRQAVAKAIEALGEVGALLHFAAIWTGRGWENQDISEWERILAVNVTGSFVLAQAVARHMLTRGSGAIVLTGSDSAKVGGVAGGPAYVASKGAVIAITHSLAKSLGPDGIRVNAINPGVVDTPMTQDWPSFVKEGAVAATPLGRLAVPRDIAEVVCFLASAAAGFMTGEVVEVNGGFYFD